MSRVVSERSDQAALPRLLIILLGALGAAGAIFLMRQLSWLIAPAFLALNMVIVVYPLQTVLRRLGVPKAIAIVLTAVALFILLVVIGLMASWAIGQIVGAVPHYIPQVMDKLSEWTSWLDARGIKYDAFQQGLDNLDVPKILGAATQVFSGFSGVIAFLGVIISMLLMVLLDLPSWDKRMQAADVSHPHLVRAMNDFASGVRKYWLACTGFGALMAVLNYATLRILDVPLPLIWAMLTWLMTYVPSVGFFFSLIPPLLVALVANDWQTALWLAGIYFVTTWIVQGIFQPKVTGNAVGVNATVSLLSLMLWAWVFGPIGALIALPATQCVKSLLIDVDPRSTWISTFIASEVEEPEEIVLADGENSGK